MDREDFDEEARKEVERRSGELADKLEPQQKPANRRDAINKSRKIGEEKEKEAKEKSAAAKEGKGKKEGGKAGETGDSEAKSEGSESSEASYEESDFREAGKQTFADVLKGRAERKKKQKEFYAAHPWRRYFDPIKSIAQKVKETLRQKLQIDTDYELEGNYYSGPKINMRRAIEVIAQNEAGVYTNEDMKIFQRKNFPTQRSHRFVVVLDQSGSMKDEGRQRAALEAMALFQEVMEGLRTGYAIIGFADTADVFKSFDEKISLEKEKDHLLETLEVAGGGGTNDLEGVKMSEHLLDQEDADEKTVIVITDGEGVDTTSNYVKEMEKKGIRVIGIGIGEGMDAVNKVYTDSYVSPDLRALPQVLLKILMKRMMGGRN